MKPPISDPFAPPILPEEESKIFGQSFWRVYFGILLSSAISSSVIIGFLWFALISSPIESRLLILLSVSSVLLVVNPLLGAALATTSEFIEVSRLGIRTPHFPEFAEWSQMKKVHSIWPMYTAPISIRGQFFKMQLPLTLKDSKGFARAVEEWAPIDNPLRLWIEKRGL